MKCKQVQFNPMRLFPSRDDGQRSLFIAHLIQFRIRFLNVSGMFHVKIPFRN